MAGSAYGPLTAVTLPARPVMEKHKDQAAILADASITYAKYSGGELFQTRDLAVLELADEGATDHHFEGADGAKFYEGGPNFSTWERFREAVVDHGQVWPDGTTFIVANYLGFFWNQGAADVSAIPNVTPVWPFHAEHWGAVGDCRNEDTTLGTDDTAAIQEAIEWLGGSTRRGGTIHMRQRYQTTAPLIIDSVHQGVILEGTPIMAEDSATISIHQKGVIFANFTDGPVLWIQDATQLRKLTITGTVARRAAPITTGVGNTNCGVLVEPEDVPDLTLNLVKLDQLKITAQPADGLMLEGAINIFRGDSVYVADVGRHGVTITAGFLSGRVNNQYFIGQIDFDGGKAFDCGGHVLALGHPDGGSSQPYRVNIRNREGQRGCLDPTMIYANAATYLVGKNVFFHTCASGGTTTGNVANHSSFAIGGRDVNLLGCRYIGCLDYYVRFVQVAGFTTKHVKIWGGQAVSSSAVPNPPPYFAEIISGPDDIEINIADHDCANDITDIPVGATIGKIILHGPTSIKFHDMTLDVSNAKMQGASKTLSIASDGSVTVDGPGLYYIDTENDAATDDLVTIHGGVPGMRITLRQSNSGRTVTLARTGNIRPHGAADYPFPGSSTFVDLIFDEQDDRWKSPSPPATV